MGRARVVAPPFLLPPPLRREKEGRGVSATPSIPLFLVKRVFSAKKGDPTSRATEEDEEEMGQGAPGWKDGQRRRR